VYFFQLKVQKCSYLEQRFNNDIDLEGQITETLMKTFGKKTILCRTEERFSLLVKFDRDRVPSKKFFSPQGFHYWDELNSQYQGSFYRLTSSGLPLLGRAQQPVPR
jgi:hypothetical protein